MGIETAVMAAIGVASMMMQKNNADRSYKAQQKASETMQAQNEALLNEQQAANTKSQEATALENQAATNTTRVEAGGTAAVSEDSGYSGEEIRRRKRNASTISTSLGL